MSRGIEARYSCGHKAVTIWPDDVETAIPAPLLDEMVNEHRHYCPELGQFVSRRFLTDVEMYGPDDRTVAQTGDPVEGIINR